MAWDIYGNTLERGHCEVHPWVHEEYPCPVCFAERQQYDAELEARREAHLEEERAYYEELTRDSFQGLYGEGI
jgi:hypothetical protein